MPRVAGQIDRAKTEAILEATAEAIYTRGLGVSVDEIARRAGVSKQTIYNHYGSKADLIRALVENRAASITAPLDVPGAIEFPQEALARYARALLETISIPRGVALFRLIIANAGADPDLARSVFKAGARTTRSRLADFLDREAKAGRMAVPDPGEAADFFAGMVISQHQLAGLLGLDSELTPQRIEHIATEAARRFMRAYRP
jgi:TetR/AcrR family transcriptional repressor of mexJK operon